MRRIPGCHHVDLRKNLDAKRGKIRIYLLACCLLFPKNPDVRCGEIRAITTEISEKSGSEMGRNPDLLAACLLLAAKQCFGAFWDV